MNCTNRCFLACTFCLRNTKQMIKDNSLWLEYEPSVEMIIDEFEKYDLNDFKEVVFCGFGEPLIRHDDVMEVARYLKSKRSDLPIRINTNGLGDLINKKDIAPLLKGLIDTVSISLNAPTAEEYVKVTRPKFGTEAFYAMIEFAKYVKENIGDVAFSVVNVINDEQIERCKSLADEMGIPLRVREKEE